MSKKVWTTTMGSPMVKENVLAYCNRMGVQGWEPFHIEAASLYGPTGPLQPTVFFKRLETLTK